MAPGRDRSPGRHAVRRRVQRCCRRLVALDAGTTKASRSERPTVDQRPIDEGGRRSPDPGSRRPGVHSARSRRRSSRATPCCGSMYSDHGRPSQHISPNGAGIGTRSRPGCGGPVSRCRRSAAWRGGNDIPTGRHTHALQACRSPCSPLPRSIDISSAGGVAATRLTRPACCVLAGWWVAEMLAWDAPFGGYLIRPASAPVERRTTRPPGRRAGLRDLVPPTAPVLGTASACQCHRA